MVSLGWLSPSLSPSGCIVFSLIIQKSSRFFKNTFNFLFIKRIGVFKFLDNCKFCVSVEVMIRTVEVPISANCISSTDILKMVVEPKIKGRLGFSNILFMTIRTIHEVYYVGTFAVHLVVDFV